MSDSESAASLGSIAASLMTSKSRKSTSARISPVDCYLCDEPINYDPAPFALKGCNFHRERKAAV